MQQVNHAVSIQEIARPGHWVEYASFRYRVDADHYAQRLSNQDRHERVVRVESSDHYCNAYYRCGEEIVAEGEVA